MSTVYNTMLKIDPDTLTNIFLTQYIHDFGEKKAKEVISKVQKSEKVQGHIRYLIQTDQPPTDVSIGSVLHTIPFFILSKPETLCLGGLVFINLWKEKIVDTYDGPFEEAFEILKLKLAGQVCSDYLVRCSRMKLTKVETCFTKFFVEIKVVDEIMVSEEKDQVQLTVFTVGPQIKYRNGDRKYLLKHDTGQYILETSDELKYGNEVVLNMNDYNVEVRYGKPFLDELLSFVDDEDSSVPESLVAENWLVKK